MCSKFLPYAGKRHVILIVMLLLLWSGNCAFARIFLVESTTQQYIHEKLHESTVSYDLSAKKILGKNDIELCIMNLKIKPMSHHGRVHEVPQATIRQIEGIKWVISRNAKGKPVKAVATVGNSSFAAFKDGHLAIPTNGSKSRPQQSVTMAIELLKDVVLDLPKDIQLGDILIISNKGALENDDSFGSDSMPRSYAAVQKDTRYWVYRAAHLVRASKSTLSDVGVFTGYLKLTNNSHTIIPFQELDIWSHFRSFGGYTEHRHMTVKPIGGG